MANKTNTVVDEMIFVGEYIYSMDSQKRFAIPKEWRNKDEENKFFIIPGRHNSLQMMTHYSFKKLAEKLRKVSMANPKASVALAKLGASAKECKCDKQGRVALNEKLLEYAEVKRTDKIDSELVLVGAFNNIQIWSKANWEKQQISDGEMLDVLQEIEEMPDDLTELLKR